MKIHIKDQRLNASHLIRQNVNLKELCILTSGLRIFEDESPELLRESHKKLICLLPAQKNKTTGLSGLVIRDAQTPDILKLLISSRNLKSLEVSGCEDQRIPASDFPDDANIVLESKTS